MKHNPSLLYSAILACFGLHASMRELNAGDVESAAEIAQKVLVRRQAIFSGRFDFRLQWGFHHKGARKVAYDNGFRYSIVGENWAKRYRSKSGGLINPTINFDGKLLTFGSARQNDGSIEYSLHVNSPRVGDASFVRNESPDSVFVYAGTIWHRITADYIKKHAPQVAINTAKINGIDTLVIEWQASRREMLSKAFDAVYSQSVADGDYAILRLFVAPSLGYAIPRYEYLGPDGALLARFDSSRFREVAPGIYFPTTSEVQRYNRKPDFFAQFDFSKVDFVNGEVPAKDFQFQVPKGAIVSDNRPGKQKTFVLGERISTTDLDQWYDESVQPVIPAESQWGIRGWIVISNVVLVLLVLAYLLTRRFYRKKG